MSAQAGQAQTDVAFFAGQTGGGKKEEGDESDDEVEIGRTVVSLRCPMSGSRMRVPARFAAVGGLNAFDLDTFLDLVQRSRKWQCPHSMRNLPVQQLLVDGYLSHILSRLQVPSHTFSTILSQNQLPCSPESFAGKWQQRLVQQYPSVTMGLWTIPGMHNAVRV